MESKNKLRQFADLTSFLFSLLLGSYITLSIMNNDFFSLIIFLLIILPMITHLLMIKEMYKK